MKNGTRWIRCLAVMLLMLALAGCGGEKAYYQTDGVRYDSYVFRWGSAPLQTLNQTYDAGFLACDLTDGGLALAQTACEYIAEHYKAERVILEVSLADAVTPGESGEFSMSRCTALEQADLAVTHDLEDYLEEHAGAFALSGPVSLSALEACMDHVRSVKELCDEEGVGLTVICPPLYSAFLEKVDPAQAEEFYRRLAEITPFWDFSYSSLSFDARYFRDASHCRTDVFKMMLARVAGTQGVYVPQDFGRLVSGENLEDHLGREVRAQTENSTPVPILMYHHLTEEEAAGDTISARRFAQHMQALDDAGYTTVTFEDLKAYVEAGTPLPEKPIVITFDDGYESNLLLAYPALKEHGMRATIFAIGVSIGKDTYKDTGVAMTPHFSLEEAAAYADVFTIQSHGYNLHEVKGRDPEPLRQGVLPREGETLEEYTCFLRADCATMNELFERSFGRNAQVLAYPYGSYSDLSEEILHEAGIWATVTSDFETTTLVKGIPQSLLQMSRYTVSGEHTAEDVLALIAGEE